MKKFSFDDVPKEFPFYGTYEEFQILFKNIYTLKERITKSENPREIIFDSWFIFDYFSRRMILRSFQLDDYENKNLDLMYGLLPQSFDSCLTLFENILNNQRDIYENKKHPNTFIKFQESDIKMNGGFIAYMMNQKNELFNSFFNEYFEYLQKNETDYNNVYHDWDYEKFKVYKIVNKNWINTCSKIDNQWFKTVRKLNKTRNKAAHLYNENEIYESFGINGKDKSEKLNKLKSAISELLQKTLNLDL